MPSPQELEEDPRFPWTRELLPKSPAPPTIPEPPRAGDDRSDCPLCARGDEDYLWVDEHWRLLAYTAIPLRGCVILESRAHADSFADLPEDVLATLGRVTARVERAVLTIGDVGRVHVARWGEGIAHFHEWVMPRPLGALGLRGPSLMPWMEALPPLDESRAAEAHAAVAAAMRG
jgi:diadenosine tetraphosphate (Ap4A) HIT family hydrolase